MSCQIHAGSGKLAAGLCWWRGQFAQNKVVYRSGLDIGHVFGPMYRSPVKEWQVSWFALGVITLNGIDNTVQRFDRNVKTFSADSSAIFANNGVCVIQSYCPQNNSAGLPLFYWRGVLTQYTC